MDKPTLKERARNIAHHLDPDGIKQRKLPRPIILEFTGPPDTGKTTVIDAFDTFFRRVGFLVQRPQEGAEVIRHIPRDDPKYNIATGIYQLDLILKAERDRVFDLFLFDRALYDSFSWMQYWLQKGKLSEEEARAYQRFFTDPRWRKSIDVAYYLICDPEEAIRRNLQGVPIDEFGGTTNPESLKLLTDIVTGSYEHWKAREAPVTLLDTTHLSQREVASDLLEKTITLLERRFDVTG
ncbi:MAG: hypothetical protein IH987_00350 [Planctomycetes bacterium]|nr:hypothetical protein [Planctomycetota bacterium]